MSSEPNADTSSADSPSPEVELPVVIPVLAEELSVGKITEKTGRALRVRVTAREETQRIPVIDHVEELSVERVPVNRLVDARAAAREEGDVLIVPVYEAVAVVEQRLMLREDLRITRRQRTVTREEEVVLRREVAIVERRDTPDGEWRADDADA
jgi:stress response protein YsnF